MALVSTGWSASIKLVDSGGNPAFIRPDIVAADATEAATNTLFIANLLAVITDALVVSYSYTETFAEDSGAKYGDPGSEVEARAEVTCPLEAPGKSHTFVIPAPNDVLFMSTVGPGKNKVNVNSGPLLAYINCFTNETGYSTPGPDAIALVSDGEKIRPDNDNDQPFVDSGKRTHRGSRKG